MGTEDNRFGRKITLTVKPMKDQLIPVQIMVSDPGDNARKLLNQGSTDAYLLFEYDELDFYGAYQGTPSYPPDSDEYDPPGWSGYRRVGWKAVTAQGSPVSFYAYFGCTGSVPFTVLEGQVFKTGSNPNMELADDYVDEIVDCGELLERSRAGRTLKIKERLKKKSS